MTGVTTGFDGSGLYHSFGTDPVRQSATAPKGALFAPAVHSFVPDATPNQSRKLAGATMTKKRVQFDIRNPFIPSLDPVCRTADQVLLFGVALIALAAALAALFSQF